MGIFGKQTPFDAYGSTMPEPSIGAKILNLVGENLLGVDYLGMKKREDAATQQKQFITDLLGKLSPQMMAGTPGDPGTGPTMKGPGEDGAPIGPAFTPPTAAMPPTMAPPQLNANSPGLAAMMLKGNVLGVPTTGVMDALKAQQPDVNYVNGFRYDRKVPGSGPAFAPTLDKGQEPLFDANGRIAGVRNIDGSVQSAAEMAGAVSGAQAKATAHYQLPTLNLPGGDTQQIPGDVAPEALLRSIMGGPGSVPGLGRSQTPAAKIAAEGAAKTQVDRTALLPKQNSMLQELDNRSQLTSQIIHQILGDAPVTDKDGNPTGVYKKGGADPMIRWYTTGFGANLAPINGTPQHDLSAQIDHVRAMTALDELQKLRDDSPTGAGLGRVTQQEINLLAAMRGSIDQGQSGSQLAQNLRRQLGQLDQIRANRHRQYQETYGGSQAAPAQASATGRSAPPPQAGQVVKGYKFLGGNPADPKSWARP